MRIREVLALSAALALGLGSKAHAGNELYLRWDDCLGDGGTYNKVFACDTNAGEFVLVGSFRLETTIAAMSGVFAVVNLTSLGSTLPSWWDLPNVVGGCRRGSLVPSFTAPPTSSACVDPWTPGSATGGYAWDYPHLSPDMARIRLQWAVPAGNQFPVPAGQETFAFRLRIDRRFTTGPSACAGCLTPVCIGWGWALVTVDPGSGSTINVRGWETPDNGSNVTWQPGAVATTVGSCNSSGLCNSYMICQAVTPTRAPTWGGIKSLYR